MLIKDTGFPIHPYASKVSKKTDEIKTSAAAKSGKTAAAASSGLVSQSARTDTIELSSRPEPSDQFVSELKKELCAEIGKDADPARLQQLKAAVGNGSYSMDSGELAGILLFGE